MRRQWMEGLGMSVVIGIINTALIERSSNKPI